jgi:PAS domain S-box-containing protein
MHQQDLTQELVRNPAIRDYIVSFRKSEVLCVEGADTKDLFILLSGKLELFKGSNKFAEISDEGAPVGEISFLLGSERTATVKALTDVEAVRIPAAQLEQVLEKFPSLMWRIAEFLARRLDARTETLHALKEFCDHLPDAVVAAKKDGNIIAWNRAAETLFGCGWAEMEKNSMAALYLNPEQFRKALDGLKKSDSVREEIFKVKHPLKGDRYIATNLSVLSDSQGRTDGVLAMSRDVTEIQKIKRRYQRFRLWLIPLLVALSLGAAAFFYASPQFLEDKKIISIKQQALRDQIANDYQLLKSILTDAFISSDREKANQAMQEFLRLHKDALAPYRGVILLGTDKRVFAAFAMDEKKKPENIIGSSYAGVPFTETANSGHNVLSLYWADGQQSLGQKGIEIAFRIVDHDREAGWLVLQMDADRLAKEFDADEETLRIFKF